MKKYLKTIFAFMMLFVVFVSLVACGNTKGTEGGLAEKVELATATLSEVEFENAQTVKVKTEENTVTVSGTIDAMSLSQKNAFGSDDVSHVVVLKYTFDQERTLSSFEIKGKLTKVYSDNSSDQNYVGSLNDLLDNESGEDSYANLILSANTESYLLTAKYSDGTISKIQVKIVATLATATSE